jgi:hypothetical protein
MGMMHECHTRHALTNVFEVSTCRSSCAVLQAELAGMQAEHDRLVSNAHLQQQYQQHQQYQVPAGGPHHMQGTRVLLAAAQPYPGTSSVKTGRHMPGGNQYAGATAGTWANHGPHNTHGPAPSSATGQHGHAATTGHGYHHSSSRVPWSAAADGQGLAQGQQPGAEAGGNNNMYIVELPDSDEEEQVHRDERGASGTARTAHAHTEQGFQGGMGAGWAAADNQGRPGHMPHAKSTTQHAGPGQQGQNGQMPPQQQGVSCAVRETVINRQVRQSPHTVMQHTVTVTEVMQQQPNSGYSAGAGSSLSPAKPSGPVSGAADTAATAAKPKKAKAPKHVGELVCEPRGCSFMSCSTPMLYGECDPLFPPVTVCPEKGQTVLAGVWPLLLRIHRCGCKRGLSLLCHLQ